MGNKGWRSSYLHLQGQTLTSFVAAFYGSLKSITLITLKWHFGFNLFSIKFHTHNLKNTHTCAYLKNEEAIYAKIIQKYAHDLHAGQYVSIMLLFRTHNLTRGTLVFINMLYYKQRHRNGQATHKYVNENDVTVLTPDIKAIFSQKTQNEPFHIWTTQTKICILLENQTHTIHNIQ